MAKLGVNIDHVATLRQARGTSYPDPSMAFAIAECAGADQITIHLREDRRHIQDADLHTLRGLVKTRLNLELAATDEIVGIACNVVPNMCTFVPERRQEITTEGGLDVAGNFERLRKFTSDLKKKNVIVSMFIEPDKKQIEMSKECGANAVEFHTGKYCELTNENDIKLEVARLKDAALIARKYGLYVAAGHGLNYDNTARIVKEIPEIEEYNIGHSIIARAVFVGLDQAVREMKKIITENN